MPKSYWDLGNIILKVLQRQSNQPIPLRQLVQAVKQTYEGEAPSKVTVWRAVRRLASQQLIEVQTRKVIREFTECLLLPVKRKPLTSIDELLTPQLRSRQLQTAMRARQAVRGLTHATASSYTPPKPEEVLTLRTEGELAAIIYLARKSFNQFFQQKSERTYLLKGGSPK